VIRVANAELVLVLPLSYCERIDLLTALQEGIPHHRIAAAALGLCWPRVRRKIPYGGKVSEYGAKVVDTLLTEGASLEQIYEHGAKAIAMIADAPLPTPAGVDAAVGNSDAPTPST
jgi:hypothetical protein